MKEGQEDKDIEKLANQPLEERVEDLASSETGSTSGGLESFIRKDLKDAGIIAGDNALFVTIQNCVKGIMIVTAVSFVVLLVVRVVHLILPECVIATNGMDSLGCRYNLHGWLTDDQLGTINSFLLSGTALGLLSDFVKDVIQRGRERFEKQSSK